MVGGVKLLEQTNADLIFSKGIITPSRYRRRSSVPVDPTMVCLRVLLLMSGVIHQRLHSRSCSSFSLSPGLCVAGEDCPSWMVPISICTSDDPTCTKLNLLLDRPEMTITLSSVSPDQWVKVSWCLLHVPQ